MAMQAQARICPVCFDDHSIERLCYRADIVRQLDTVPQAIQMAYRMLAKAERERDGAREAIRALVKYGKFHKPRVDWERGWDEPISSSIRAALEGEE